MLVQKQTLSRTGCDFTDTTPNVASNTQKRRDERWQRGRQAAIAELIARIREGSRDALNSTEKTKTQGATEGPHSAFTSPQPAPRFHTAPGEIPTRLGWDLITKF